MSLIDHFRVAIMSLNIAEGEKAQNLNAVRDQIERLPEGTDLFVVPELFSTGYISVPEQAKALAEPNDGETLTELKRLSKAHRIAICGSYLATDGDSLYNRGFFIEPNGEVTYYDKRHLFCVSEESKICKHGANLPPVVRFRGWNLSFAICYDLRFPVWLRNIDNRYDAMIFPANWPDKRSYAWLQLLKARAIENECYTIGANRSGEDPFGTYSGVSQVFDYMGKEIGEENGSVMLATISKPSLISHREHFPAWKDADSYEVDC